MTPMIKKPITQATALHTHHFGRWKPEDAHFTSTAMMKPTNTSEPNAAEPAAVASNTKMDASTKPNMIVCKPSQQ